MDESEDQGLKLVGNLRLPTGTSPYLSDSTQREWPQSFATTGSRFPAPGGARSTGRQLSATAAGKSLSIAEAVERADPEAVDRAIVASLPPSIASTLRPMYRDHIDPRYGFDTEFLGYRLEGAVPAGDLELARQMIGQHLCPAEVGLIKRELARLRVSTKSRAETDDDLAMGFQVLAEECAEYPPDVVMWALRSWAKQETFYPSLAEIRDRLQRGVKKRRQLMQAIPS